MDSLFINDRPYAREQIWQNVFVTLDNGEVGLQMQDTAWILSVYRISGNPTFDGRIRNISHERDPRKFTPQVIINLLHSLIGEPFQLLEDFVPAVTIYFNDASYSSTDVVASDAEFHNLYNGGIEDYPPREIQSLLVPLKYELRTLAQVTNGGFRMWQVDSSGAMIWQDETGIENQEPTSEIFRIELPLSLQPDQYGEIPLQP